MSATFFIASGLNKVTAIIVAHRLLNWYHRCYINKLDSKLSFLGVNPESCRHISLHYSVFILNEATHSNNLRFNNLCVADKLDDGLSQSRNISFKIKFNYVFKTSRK